MIFAKYKIENLKFFLIVSESSDFNLVSPTASLDLDSIGETFIPVAIVTQTSLDVIMIGPTGTATTTVEITTPSIEELAIDPMDKDITESTTEHGTTTESDDGFGNRYDQTLSPEQLEDDDQKAMNVTGTDAFITDVIGLVPDLEESSCSANVCRNGGTCLSTLTGPKCHCPLQYSGRQCEEEVTVETPGFVGKVEAEFFNRIKRYICRQ